LRPFWGVAVRNNEGKMILLNGKPDDGTDDCFLVGTMETPGQNRWKTIYRIYDCINTGSGTTVSRYNKGSDAIQALKQGKADAVVIDEQPALAFVKANPDLTILEEEFANEDYAICVAKGNSLTAKLNEAIEVLMADGTIQKLIDDYVGDNATFSGYKSPDGISRTNGTLVMATNAYFKPYEYYEGGSNYWY